MTTTVRTIERLRQLGWMKRMLEQQLCKELQITDTARRSREVQDTNRKIQKVKDEIHKLREKHWGNGGSCEG
jgi:hypothetical protein